MLSEPIFDFLYITEAVITIILKFGLVAVVYHYLKRY